MASMSGPAKSFAKMVAYIVVILVSFIAATLVPGFLGLGASLWFLWYLFLSTVVIVFFSDVLAGFISPSAAKWIDIIAIFLLTIVSIIAMGMAMGAGFTMVPTLALGIAIGVVYQISGNRLYTGFAAMAIGQLMMFLGVAMGDFSQAFGGPYPPNLLVVFGFALVLYVGVHKINTSVAANIGGPGGGPSPAVTKAVTLFIVAIFSMTFMYYVVLDSNWDNTEAVSGEVLHGVGSSVNAAAGFVGDQIEAYTNFQLNPSRNPTFARMQCSMSIYFSGGVIGETSPDQLIQNCVDEKLGNNETEAESKKVTEPVRLQVEEIDIEPFSDRVTVLAPIVNNLVTDLDGRVIDIPAESIVVDIQMKRTGGVRASMERVGDRETIERLASGGDQIVEYSFPTFPIVGSATDARVEQWLLRLKECNTYDEEEVEEAPDCSGELDQFKNRFADGRLSKERVSYVNRVRTTFDFSQVSEWGLGGSGDNQISNDVWTAENTIAPNRDYTVVVDVEYEFEAEAAFTQASRWQSGNLLLELYDPSAWNQLSFDDRQAWEQRNCDALRRYGQDVTRQRTAALTTPVVPVMYTQCGNTLFRRDNYVNNVPINIGANVHPDFSKGMNEDQGFKIINANTDCGGGGDMVSVGGDIGGEMNEENWYIYEEGVGYVVEPANVTRDVGDIGGDRTSIACRAEMKFRINLLTQTNYEVPNLQ